MIAFDKNYDVSSNKESGHGRYDLYLEDLKNRVGYIFEFKVTDNEEKLDNAVEEAILQIKNQEYSYNLEDNTIYGIGMAFYKKRVKMKYLKIR